MINNNKFLSDVSKLASGAAGGLMDIKHELEEIVNAKLDKLLQKMELVTKDEFDAVKSMLTKSRMEQEELKKRLEAMESKLGDLNSCQKSTK